MTHQNFMKDPLWYKDAIIYQLHIRAFYDSNNDGIGDFKGLIEKLDYLKDLGINTIWMLPFYPSPLKDDGYDIADYTTVNPSYGDMRDFRNFVREAHARNMRVVTELVINHTSDQHEWFQLSRRAEPGSYWRDFYVWSDTPDKYKEVRIIFKDFEPSNWSYDPVAKAYYWHRFFSHQPDLNFDNPEVQKKIFELFKYWLDMGIDGMRLDAIPYLFEREGTSSENLPETHAFLKTLRAYMDENYPGKMLLAEANMWPDDAAAYFGDGDECHMNFHFPIMPRLFMAVRREDRFSILDILRQTPEIPENCQWAMFLRNHDELTLEMVTDEERDFMYSVYAKNERARINLGIRRRLAPLLGNDRRQIELLNGLLFSMTGTPIIYYGDEIGMGDNIYLGDRNGVRTPFQWSSDRNAGFSKADPQQLFLPVIQNPEYHYTTVNVENQMANETSLLRWIQGLIDMRKSNIALTRGKMNFLEPANQAVLAFTREYTNPENGESQKILVVANLSKRAQYVEMDMSAYKNLTPIELRGETPFPPIGDLPYLVTLGPYDFYWFDLQDLSAETKDLSLSSVRQLQHLPDQQEILSEPELRRQFEHLIRNYMPKARWFSSKDLAIKRVNIKDRIEVPQLNGRPNANLLFVEISYREPIDRVDTYLLAVVSAEGLEAEQILKSKKEFVIASYDLENDIKGIYYDAIIDPAFMKSMMTLICKGEEIVTDHGSLKADILWTLPDDSWCENIPDPNFISLEQSNSSLRFGHEIFFKMFRRLEEGINPEIEIGQHLNRSEFANAPRLVGSMSYKAYGRSYSIATAHKFLEGSEGSAWDLFQKEIEEFAVAARSVGGDEARTLLAKRPGIYKLKDSDLPSWFVKSSDRSARLINKLGQRTAELHNALGQDDAAYAFLPEDVTPFYLRSFYQSLRNRMVSTRNLLDKNLSGLSEDNLALAKRVTDSWPKIEKFFDRVRTGNFGGKRTRVHGDYHLGQVMFAHDDFNILDYEGEPLRPISQRRLKNTPLQDVSGLLRSVDYAIHFYLKRENLATDSDLGKWLELWRLRMSREFMAGYRAHVKASLLPDREEDIEYMTEVMLLHKALYEVSYELSSRPDWLPIPLNGILNILPGLGEDDGK